MGEGAHRRGHVTAQDERWLTVVLEEALRGRAEGGIPIAGALVHHDGRLLGLGRNRRVQEGSAILHGETSAFSNAGRLDAATLAQCVLYTTLSPCHMCAGTALLYGIKRVVVAENRSFLGAEALLQAHGVEVVVADHQATRDMFRGWCAQHPHLWSEDIGQPSAKL